MLINSPNISGSLKVTGNTVITGSLTVAGGINATITGSATSASYVEYSNVANKPALVSSSAQIVGYEIFATTGSNTFRGTQTISGSVQISGSLIMTGSVSISGSVTASFGYFNRGELYINNGSTSTAGTLYLGDGSITKAPGSGFTLSSLNVTGNSSFGTFIDMVAGSAATPQIKGVGGATGIYWPNGATGTAIGFAFSSARMFETVGVTSGVNYLRVTQAITGSSPSLSAQGTDTNINLTLTPKGSGSVIISGSLTVTGSITGSVTTASYVEYTGVANKPALVSSSAQIVGYNVFATTGSNQFDGSQAVTGSLTVTGQVVAQTLNVQQVTSSIVYSSGSNIFGNTLGNTQQFTGSVSVTGSLTVTTTGTEFQVASTGVNLGNALTDSHIISGSLRVNPNGLFVSGSGNVGIGTTTPSRILSISQTNPYISLTSTTNSREFLVGVDSSGYVIYDATAAAYRMIISSGGNVGIGTTTPDRPLDIYSAATIGIARIRANNVNGAAISIQNDENSQSISIYAAGSTAFSISGWAGNSVLESGTGIVYSAYNGNHIFQSGVSGRTERMRITSGGNVGIGSDSIANGTTFGGGGQINKLKVQSTNYTCLEINGSTSGGSVQFTYGTNLPNQVSGLIAYNYANGAANEFAISNILSGPLIFATSNTERMRITSDGAITMSVPTSGQTLTISGKNNNWTQEIRGSLTTGQSYGLLSTAGSNSADYSFYTQNSAGNVAFFSVRGDGLVAFPKINDFTTGNSPNTWINPASSYGIYINTSSRRYKKDIVTYDKGLDIVNQLRPVYYKGISEVDGDKQFVGLIAEEIHDLGLTEFVNYNEEGLPNSLSYPNMIALAFKAIQEQQAQIEILKSKIEILEQS